MKKHPEQLASGRGTSASSSSERPRSEAPVCITGMHRSGTSLVARILGACGLDLGPPEELIGPRPDNPDGFFENVNFVLLNDGILQAFGGGWDAPPDLPSGWTNDPRLEEIRRNAGALTENWASRLPWGWKDPRCSLTLPFWNELLQSLKVVVCVRHPLEVHRSLETRGYASRVFAFSLWRRYNESLMAAAPRERRIVTHYDAYFFNPKAEIRRVLSALGLGAGAATVADAAHLVSGRMRHHSGPGDERGGGPMPKEVLALYGALVDEAGDILRAADRAAASHAAGKGDQGESASGDTGRELGALHEEFSATLQDLASAREKLTAAEGELASLKAEHERALGELRGLQSSVEAAGQVAEEFRTRLSREAQERQALEDSYRTSQLELDKTRAALNREKEDRAALDRELSAARFELAELRAAKGELEIGRSAAEAALRRAHENEGNLLRSLAKSLREVKDLSVLRQKIIDMEAIRAAQEARLVRHGEVYAELLRACDTSERDLAAARTRIAEPQAGIGAAPNFPTTPVQTETKPEPEEIPLASGSIEDSPRATSTGRIGPSVLFVSHDARPHGAQIFLLRFLQWLHAKSDLPFEILLGGDGELTGRFARLGRLSYWPNSGAAAGSLPSSDPLLRRLTAAKVGLIYANTLVNGPALEGLSTLGCPAITHVHELGYWAKNRVEPADLAKVVTHSSGFIAVSNAVRDALVCGLGIPEQRVKVIRGFVPVTAGAYPHLATVREIRAELGIPEGARIVCGCGTTDWRKAPDLFVQVARAIRSRAGTLSVHFIWVGGSNQGVEFSQLWHDVEQARLDDVVHFLGHRSNPRDYFAAADVFALTSREDPFPLVNLEAATVEVPTVCFDGAGGSKEFVEDDCGFVVPYLDVEAMAGRVVEILTTPGLRDRLGRRAAEKVRERHDIEVVAPKLLELIELRLRKAAESRA